MYAIDATQVLNDFDGNPISKSESDKAPVTLGFVVIQALMSSFPPTAGKETDDAACKMDDFALAMQFRDPMLPIKVSNTQHARIMALVDKLPFHKMIVAQALTMIKRSPDDQTVEIIVNGSGGGGGGAVSRLSAN